MIRTVVRCSGFLNRSFVFRVASPTIPVILCVAIHVHGEQYRVA